MNISKFEAYYLARLPIIAFIALLICSSGLTAQIKAYPDKESANILRVEKNTPDPKIPIEPVTGSDKSSLVTNRAGTFKAFDLCLPEGEKKANCYLRVFITDKASGDTFMISGEDEYAERARVINDLKWLDNDRLSYERWMGPHFGHRYVLNVKLRKQVAAFTITDMPK